MVEDNSRTHSFILFIYDNSGYLLSQELNYLGKVFSLSFVLGRTQFLKGRKKENTVPGRRCPWSTINQSIYMVKITKNVNM